MNVIFAVYEGYDEQGINSVTLLLAKVKKVKLQVFSKQCELMEMKNGEKVVDYLIDK